MDLSRLPAAPAHPDPASAQWAGGGGARAAAPPLRRSAGYLARVALLALAYYGSGRLGLLLAVPPGYATAMWPPSGVALAGILLLGYRYWLGVLLGSFGINLLTSVAPGDTGSVLASVAIALDIACGAALQAAAGAWLVRRWVALPNALEQIRDIALLMACGGPLACLLNATIGVGSLYLAGALPAGLAVFNWLTWWVGDSIGVMVFTPVLLLAFGARGLVSARRRYIVCSALLAVFALAVAVFFAARDQEEARRRAAFDNLAQSVVANLQAQLERYLVIVRDTTAMFATVENISRHEFNRYAADITQRYPSLVGLAWSERVGAAGRAAYEQRTRAEGFADFAIREFDAAGRLVPAAPRAEYFPVTYVEPYRPQSHGFDNASEALRRDIMARARDSGDLVTSGRARLVQLGHDIRRQGVLVFSPLYRAEPAATVEQRRRQLRGFIVAGFYLPAMLASSLDNIDTRGIDFAIHDDLSGGADQWLYESRPGVAGARLAPGALRWSGRISVAGRDWTVVATSALPSVHARQSWTVWFVLASGLLFTSLLGVFALLVTAQTDVVRRLVDARTEQLRRSEERFRLLVEGTVDHAIATLDTDGFLTSWNSAAQRIYGYAAAEVVGRHFAVLYPQHQDEPPAGSEPAAARGPLYALAEARRLGHFEDKGWRQRKDGAQFWAELSLTALYDGRGRLYGYSKIERDLTARKRQEEQLEESFRQVSALKSRLALANEAGGIGVWRLDLCGGGDAFDRRTLELYGIADGGGGATRRDLVRRVSPEDRAAFAAHTLPALLGGAKQVWQYRVLLADGAVRHLCSAADAEFDERGGVSGLIGVVWDVTELVRARLAAEQATRAKSAFFANMSHEIRTPLNGILGLTSLVLESPLTPAQRDYLAQVKKSGVSLLHLLNDILDFSKMEAGKLQLAPIAFDLRDVLERGLQPLANGARAKGLQFSLRIDAALPELVRCDPHRLMQVVINLVSNAVKFTEAGCVEVAAERGAAREPGFELLLSVRDTGIGIAAAAQACVFEAFTQADSSTTRRFGGTGLGLSICRQIAELMGGRIWLHSEEGAGSEFHFAVAVEAVASDRAAAPAAPALPALDRRPAQAQALQILLAEDHPTNQNLALAILERRGHRVQLAGNGREAVEWFQRARFDVILMDVQMPEMDGLEATAAIRALEGSDGGHVRIVALTAHVLAGDRERLLEAGMDDYLAKPFFPEQLLAAVEPPAAADAPLAFDRERALARALNSEELLRRLVASFLGSLPGLRSELLAALRGADAEALYRAAHKLKGSAATFAAPACTELAGELEGLARNGALERAAALAERLEREIDRLVAALENLG